MCHYFFHVLHLYCKSISDTMLENIEEGDFTLEPQEEKEEISRKNNGMSH